MRLAKSEQLTQILPQYHQYTISEIWNLRRKFNIVFQIHIYTFDLIVFSLIWTLSGRIRILWDQGDFSKTMVVLSIGQQFLS